jgi:glycosyltransferase involved in cell wall biosynthesis
LWIVFTKDKLSKHVPGVVVADPTLYAKDFFKRADYVVGLSDIEAYGYTLVEAMQSGVPVLTTPISVLDEIGFKDGVNGYIVPFDAKEADVKKFYNKIPKFKALKNSNDEIKQQWQQLLGDTTPTHSYKPFSDFIKVMITEGYGDIELGRNMVKGEVVTMRKERALLLISLHKAEIV